VTIAKKQFSFHQDSYEEHGKMMMTPEFIKNLLNFSESGRDEINDETIELLEPYL
jgi:dynein heavy chain